MKKLKSKVSTVDGRKYRLKDVEIKSGDLAFNIVLNKVRLVSYVTMFGLELNTGNTWIKANCLQATEIDNKI